MDESQRFVTGTVRLKLYKGNVITCGRRSRYSLYDMKVASMEGVKSWYNQADATGFIRLNGLRLRARELGIRRLELGPTGGSIQFEEQNRIDAARLIGLIQRQAQEYRMEGPLKLRITRALPEPAQRFARADALLTHLSGG